MMNGKNKLFLSFEFNSIETVPGKYEFFDLLTLTFIM